MGVKKLALLGRKIKLDLDLMEEGGPAFFRMLLEKFGKGADGLFHFIARALGG
jgi:hypothetical protein